MADKSLFYNIIKNFRNKYLCFDENLELLWIHTIFQILQIIV